MKKNLHNKSTSPSCDATFCVGPPTCYPTTPAPNGPALVWEAEFDVPPLPATFDHTSMTDYIYFNIVFGYGQPHDNPEYPSCSPFCAGDGHGRYNQFVPQLMLGATLCNSSNAPDYKPGWCQLSTWHIGAQYFMGLYGCKNQSDAASCGFTPKAATGELIAVQPGQKVYTRFDRVPSKSSQGGGGVGGGKGAVTSSSDVANDGNGNSNGSSNNNSNSESDASIKEDPAAAAWRLTMGIVGDPVPPSVVIAEKPYMGLVPSAQSWASPAFSTAYPGSCWELYGTKKATDYPPYMHYKHNITAMVPEAKMWEEWRVDENPNTTATACRTLQAASSISNGGRSQLVSVNATIIN